MNEENEMALLGDIANEITGLRKQNAELLAALKKALLLLRDEVDPTADYDEWLTHMGRIGYPEFQQAIAKAEGGE